MTVLDAFEAMERTAVGSAIKESLWLFPAIEAIHLIGLAVLGGSVLIVDLRLLGIGLTNISPRIVFRSVRPYFYASLVLMFATGIPLALSETVKLYYNFSAWVKGITLIIALIFTFAVRNRVAGGANSAGFVTGLVGLISIGLWFTVAAAGRWIGFS